MPGWAACVPGCLWQRLRWEILLRRRRVSLLLPLREAAEDCAEITLCPSPHGFTMLCFNYTVGFPLSVTVPEQPLSTRGSSPSRARRRGLFKPPPPSTPLNKTTFQHLRPQHTHESQPAVPLRGPQDPTPEQASQVKGFSTGFPPVWPLEPILFPRVRIYFADFPCLPYSNTQRWLALGT